MKTMSIPKKMFGESLKQLVFEEFESFLRLILLVILKDLEKHFQVRNTVYHDVCIIDTNSTAYLILNCNGFPSKDYMNYVIIS